MSRGRSNARLMARLMPHGEAAIVMVFTVVTIVAGLGSNRFLTQTVAPRALGEFYLLMNLVGWMTLPAAASFTYVCRHWAVARATGLERKYFRAMLSGLGLLTCLAAIGALVFRALNLGIGDGATLCAFVITCVGQATAQAFVPLFAYSRRRVLAGLMELLGTPARQVTLGLAGLFVVSLAGGSLLRVQALYFAASSAGILILAEWLVRRSGMPLSPNAPELRKQLGLVPLLSHSVPFLLTGVATQLAGSAERWGLSHRSEPAATALFVQAVGISTAAAGALISFLASYYGPLITDAATKASSPLWGGWPYIRRYVLSGAGVLAVLVATFALGARLLTSLFFGAKYAPVSGLLPWTTLGAAFFSLGQMLFMVPYAVRDSIWPSAIKVGTLVAYAAALVAYPAGGDAALGFSHIYALAQAVYAGLMLVLAVVHIRLARRGSIAIAQPVPDPTAEP
jgi:hypothetical protein